MTTRPNRPDCAVRFYTQNEQDFHGYVFVARRGLADSQHYGRSGSRCYLECHAAHAVGAQEPSADGETAKKPNASQSMVFSAKTSLNKPTTKRGSSRRCNIA